MPRGPKRREEFPPPVEGQPVRVNVFVAVGAGLANFNIVDRMYFPKRCARGTASGGSAGTAVMRCVKEQLTGDPVWMRLQSSRQRSIHAVSLVGSVEDLEVPDLVPGERAIVRADFRGNTVAFLGMRKSTQRHVDVILVLGLSVAIHALAGADIGVVGLDQVRLDSDHLALAEISQHFAVVGFPLVPKGQVSIVLKVDQRLRSNRFRPVAGAEIVFHPVLKLDVWRRRPLARWPASPVDRM